MLNDLAGVYGISIKSMKRNNYNDKLIFLGQAKEQARCCTNLQLHSWFGLSVNIFGNNYALLA